MLNPESKHRLESLKDQNGQTFIEFIFILLLLVTISFGFMKGFSFFIGTRWQVMLTIIAKPNPIEFPTK